MVNRSSLLQYSLSILASVLASAIVTVLVLTLALAAVGWGNVEVLDVFGGVLHYLKELPVSLIWQHNNMVGDALVIPLFSITLGFLGLGYMVHSANSKQSWLKGVMTILFFVAVVGFWSNRQYYDSDGWLYVSSFIVPYALGLVLFAAILIRWAYARLDVTSVQPSGFLSIFVLATAAALIAGVFELIQLVGYFFD